MANKSLVPNAKDALNRFKMEAANEIDVQSDINKHLTKPLITTFCKKNSAKMLMNADVQIPQTKYIQKKSQ